jgi:hypothetical protein
MQQTALTLEDYIGESYVKCANIILGSRIFQSEQQKPPADRRSGRWVGLFPPISNHPQAMFSQVAVVSLLLITIIS